MNLKLSAVLWLINSEDANKVRLPTFSNIKISFHPVEERFEVLNPAILKDKAWVNDIAEIIRLARGRSEYSGDMVPSD
jgi:hypothetical protein